MYDKKQPALFGVGGSVNMLSLMVDFSFLQIILVYQWLEDSLRLGEKASQDIYILKDEASGEACHQSSGDVSSHGNGYSSGNEELPHHKKQKISSPEKPKDPTLSLPVDSRHSSAESKGTATSDELHEESLTSRNYDLSSSYLESQTANFNVAENPDKVVNINPFVIDLKLFGFFVCSHLQTCMM